MKKLIVCILILCSCCFSFACVKAHYEDKYMVYETQKTLVHICIMQSGCDNNGLTYYVIDKKTALITEIQYCDSFRSNVYKTYTNTSKDKLIAYDYDDTRRKALHNYLETEYAKCLIK